MNDLVYRNQLKEALERLQDNPEFGRLPTPCEGSCDPRH